VPPIRGAASEVPRLDAARSVELVADLLIIEDDELIASSLARALRAEGHRATVANSVAEARRSLADPDLVLCDLGLPDGDGLDLVAEIVASRPTTPILVLTARAEEADIVAALSTGAVDYLTKPFRLAELQARIAAHLRHVAAHRADPARVAPPIDVGDLRIDERARMVTIAGRPVELRPKEFDLLARLAAEVGAVVRREELMHDVWDEHWFGSTKTLDVHVAALRSKIDAPHGPSRISTLRGVGYRLEAGDRT
jgi:DNA-binding response OmpR family regulator